MRGLLLRTGGVAAALALLALATFTAATPASADGAKLSMDSVLTTRGSNTTLDLTAGNVPSPGVGAWTVGVVYDPAILSIPFCEGGIGSSECNPAYAANRVQITGADADGQTGDAVLGSITFRCESIGASDLQIIVTHFADATPGGPQPLDIKLQNGRVTCGQPDLLGDVDCNGVVDSRDAQLVLQYVAALIDSLPCFHLGDMDSDGDVDSIDASLILQIEAGLIQLQ